MSGDGPPLRGPVTRMVPDGDNRVRDVCTDCGFVHFRNPVVVVGAVAAWEGKLLLCRRAIPPREGFWTIPAGYLEAGESAAEGALREAREEACADLAIERPLAVYSIPRLSQVQVIFAARLRDGSFAAGPESREVRLFAWDEVPGDELAFPSVRWALDDWKRAEETGERAAAVRSATDDTI